GRGLFSLVEVIDRHETAAALEGFPKSWLILDPLRLGVDVGKPNLEVFGPIRHQAPPHYVEAAFSRLGIVADDWQRMCRRDIPTWREIGRRPMRRDRKDELDLAHVGGKTDASTHGGNIAVQSRVPKPKGASGRLIR